MRVVFMGTPEFAVPILKALLDSPGHEVAAVVSQPDRPKGRGRKLEPTPVKALAEAHGVPALQPKYIRSKNGERQKAFARELAEYRADAIVVAAYGKILPPELLELPRHGCLNVHGSLLPKYRGAAPVQWAIANGDRETGVAIMQMDEGLDTGDVLAEERLDILDDDDAISVANALSVLGARKIVEVLDAIDAGNAPEPRPQSGMGEPSFAPILTKEDGLIDWTASTEAIICRMQGFKPWPGAYGTLHGEPFFILKAESYDHLVDKDAPADKTPPPGQVVAAVKGRGFTVRTGSGELLALEVKPRNKGAMPAHSAINGRVVKEGDSLAG